MSTVINQETSEVRTAGCLLLQKVLYASSIQLVSIEKVILFNLQIGKREFIGFQESVLNSWFFKCFLIKIQVNLNLKAVSGIQVYTELSPSLSVPLNHLDGFSLYVPVQITSSTEA